MCDNVCCVYIYIYTCVSVCMYVLYLNIFTYVYFGLVFLGKHTPETMVFLWKYGVVHEQKSLQPILCREKKRAYGIIEFYMCHSLCISLNILVYLGEKKHHPVVKDREKPPSQLLTWKLHPS